MAFGAFAKLHPGEIQLSEKNATLELKMRSQDIILVNQIHE